MKLRNGWMFLMVTFVTVAFSTCFQSNAFAEDKANNKANGNELVIADFDTGDKPNNIGGDFGAWDKDPNDETQGAQVNFADSTSSGEKIDALGDQYGYALRIDYDVDSPNPAYNGFWMKLNQLNATPYNAVSFFIKGDKEAGFTSRVKVELKDKSNQPSPYLLSGVTSEWQQVTIPFDKFRKVTDWSAMNEFVVVFDDINSNPKKGSIYLDQVSFKKV